MGHKLEVAQPRSPRENRAVGNKTHRNKTWFKCGMMGHLARQCTQSGITCFKCHKANECNQEEPRTEAKNEDRNIHVVTEDKNESSGNSILSNTCLFKDLEINGHTF